MVIGLTFSIGPLGMSPSRALFLILVPVLAILLMIGQRGRFAWMDALVFFHLAWLTFTISVNNPEVVVQFTGSTAVTILGGYLVGRCGVRNPGQFISVTKCLAWIVVLSLPFALMESLTNRNVLAEFLSRLPGIGIPGRVTGEQRLGLYRAQFLLPHPITYGFFCSLVFPLVVLGMKDIWSFTRRVVFGGMIGLCCFLSLSSGAVLALAVQLVLVSWGWIMANVASRWKILMIATAIFYTIVEVLSDRPALIAILSRVALNPHTVGIRNTLFQFGSEQIGKTPFMGVGYNDWGLPPWMSGSIDNFWLLLGVVYGLPTLLSLAGAIFGSMAIIGRRRFATPPLTAQRYAWIVMMVSMSLTLATVAIWGQMHSLVMFLFAFGLWMRDYVPTEIETSDAMTPDDGQPSSRYSRFTGDAAPTAARAKGQAASGKDGAERDDFKWRRART